MSSTECAICAESCNKSSRLPVRCEYCDFVACRKCCQTFLLNEPVAKCMNTGCGREWTRHFLARNFTQTFNNHELKEHRKRVMFDRERSRLPDTQAVVELHREYDHLGTRYQDLCQEMYRIRNEITNLGSRRYHIKRRIDAGIPLPNDSSSRPLSERIEFVRACPDAECRGYLSTQWKCGVCEKWTCSDCHEIKGPSRDSPHECKPENVASAALVMRETKPCPTCHTSIFKIDGCFAHDTRILMHDGSLRFAQDVRLGDTLMGDDQSPRTVTRMIRGQDEMYQVSQADAAPYTVSSYHVLVLKVDSQYRHKDVSPFMEIAVTDYLRSHKYVQRALRGFKSNGKETEIRVDPVGRRPFYGWETDGNRRFLLHDRTVVHNCNQMFCTKCHTAFDWRTGRPIQGAIHNPHYFEYMRSRQGNAELPQLREEINCNQELTNRFMANLGDLLRASTIEGRIQKDRRVMYICRNAMHLQHVVIPAHTTDSFDLLNEQLRVQYMMNELSEDRFKTLIQRNDKRYQKNLELSQVFELVLRGITDILYRLREALSQREEIEPFLTEVDSLVDYANEHLAEINMTYGSTVVHTFSKSLDHSTVPLRNRVSENDSTIV